MPKFLIEVPYAEGRKARLQVVRISLATGSHFLSNCDWGCIDGDHKAWMTVDVDSKEDALRIVPPMFRKQAKIVQLTKFSLGMVKTNYSGQAL